MGSSGIIDISLYNCLLFQGIRAEQERRNSMNFVIEHLSKAFEKKQVLKDITFTFDSGKIYGLLGRNGAGKTTLLTV